MTVAVFHARQFAASASAALKTFKRPLPRPLCYRRRLRVNYLYTFLFEISIPKYRYRADRTNFAGSLSTR
jgi:hypothetical protein